MKKNFHFAFVSNAQAAAQVVQTLAPSMGIDVDIHVAAMEQAITVARDLYANGIEIIIGCGSTGRMLQRCACGHVVTISNIPLAILRALNKAKKYSDTIALPYYETIPEWLNILADVMHLKLIPVIFHDTQSLVTCTSEIVDRGIKCVVGSNIAVQVAKAQGCHGVEVVYSEHEIQHGLEEALRLAKVLEKRDIQMEFLRNVAETIRDRGVVCVDNDIKRFVMNSQAKFLLHCKNDEPKYLREKIEESGVLATDPGRQRQGNFIIDVNKDRLSASVVPVTFNGDVRGSMALLQRLGEGEDLARRVSFKSRYTFEDMAGHSAAMRELRRQASVYARTDATLLIQGETGTGKELLAHSIHDASQRRDAPFVALNCAALPESLLESELFGYEEGAFTGAKRGGKDGIFAMAQGGTVFLDEIADISPTVQIRLLRVLEAREMMRVGGDRIIPVDVRVISSSWKRLGNEVRKGRFRADLYFRLSVLTLTLPPLRERIEDLPEIIALLLKRRGLANDRLSPDSYELMARHAWPGNIRELDTVLQRYYLLAESAGPDDHLLAAVLQRMREESVGLSTEAAPVTPPTPEATPRPAADGFKLPASASGHGTLREQLDGYEREIIAQALTRHHHNKVNTAKSLGISPNTLWRKMNALGNE